MGRVSVCRFNKCVSLLLFVLFYFLCTMIIPEVCHHQQCSSCIVPVQRHQCCRTPSVVCNRPAVKRTISNVKEIKRRKLTFQGWKKVLVKAKQLKPPELQQEFKQCITFPDEVIIEQIRTSYNEKTGLITITAPQRGGKS